MITTSRPRARPASTASNATAAGSPPRRRADEVGARPLGPDLELLLGRGAERVAGADEHRAAVLAQLLGELADGRRLARAVDADDEDHGRLRAERERGRVAEQQLDLLGQRLAEVAELAAGLEPPHDLGRRPHADVAVDERLLEPLPRLLVACVEGAGGDLGGQRPAALRERVAQAAEEAASARARPPRSARRRRALPRFSTSPQRYPRPVRLTRQRVRDRAAAGAARRPARRRRRPW